MNRFFTVIRCTTCSSVTASPDYAMRFGTHTLALPVVGRGSPANSSESIHTFGDASSVWVAELRYWNHAASKSGSTSRHARCTLPIHGTAPISRSEMTDSRNTPAA